MIARIADDEVIVESPGSGQLVQQIDEAAASPSPGVYRVEQQPATFLLQGPRAPAVLAQTCGINMVEEPAGRIVYTRVAGVSCGLIPEGDGPDRVYRLWVDYSYAPALFESLLDIAGELGAA